MKFLTNKRLLVLHRLEINSDGLNYFKKVEKYCLWCDDSRQWKFAVVGRLSLLYFQEVILRKQILNQNVNYYLKIVSMSNKNDNWLNKEIIVYEISEKLLCLKEICCLCTPNVWIQLFCIYIVILHCLQFCI